MKPHATRRRKPPNGRGESGTYKLVFNLDSDSELKAWQVAQQLASDRKLKHVIISLLLAIYTVQEQTRKKIDMLSFISQFISGLVLGVTRPIIHNEPEKKIEDIPLVAGTSSSLDIKDRRKAFSGSSLTLSSDDDDLWDD